MNLTKYCGFEIYIILDIVLKNKYDNKFQNLRQEDYKRVKH